MTNDGKQNLGNRLSFLVGSGLLVIALLYSGWMMVDCASMGEPFTCGFLGKNGARYSIMAKNVLRCDVAAVNYVPLLNPEAESDPDPYLHHPPLLHWVLALSFKILGETEDHARLVPFIFSLLSVLIIFLLGKHFTGSVLGGGFCAASAAALPMMSYYGAHIDVQGSPLTFCILSTLYCYCQWLRRGGKAWYCLALLFMILGTLFDWPALYLCLLIPLHYWFHQARGFRSLVEAVKKTWAFPALGILLFILLVIWLSTAGAPKGTTLFESLLQRSIQPGSHIDMSQYDLWSRLKDYCFPAIHRLYPWPFLALLFLGLRGAGKNTRQEHLPRPQPMLWLLFLLGMIHVVLFPLGILVHDYWVFLFLPWVALCSGLVLYRMNQALPGKGAGGKTIRTTILIAILGVLFWAGTIYSLEQKSNEEQDPLAVELGKRIHHSTEPGQAVIVNASDYNRPISGPGDRYVLVKPALAYYADRVVRGGVETPEALQNLLGRREDFAYFVFITDYRTKQTALLEYLQKNYPEEKKIPELMFFRLNNQE